MDINPSELLDMITNLPLPNHILYVCDISVIAMTVSDFSTLAQQKNCPRYGQSRRGLGKLCAGHGFGRTSAARFRKRELQELHPSVCGS